MFCFIWALPSWNGIARTKLVPLQYPGRPSPPLRSPGDHIFRRQEPGWWNEADSVHEIV